jgi:hypothetical protein
MSLLEQSEAKEKFLIGLTIGDKLITDKTKDESWPGNFGCSYNKLTSLEGAPSSVGGNFGCSYNKLTSLEGAPASVGGYFICSYNQLTSLKGIHKILKQMNGTFYAQYNPLKSHVMGLLLVKGCKEVSLDNKVVQEVLNRYLPNTRGSKAVIEAQSELLDLDLEDWAQL